MRCIGRIVALAAALAASATPVFAAGMDENTAEPAKLTDSQLDQVSGGDGSLLNLPANINILLKDISVVVNVSNVPINAAAAVQVNALGSAAQTATVQALQSVTQLQTLAPLGQ